MSKFQERPASHHSLIMRKIIYGVATNDATYVTQYRDDNGVLLTCPFYNRWKNMLKRCYNRSGADKTYKDCYVTDKWLLFSNFRKWMERQDWVGKDLDKDLLFKGNKVYHPERCLFISKELNYLLLDSGGTRGRYPQGVSWCKAMGKYRARLRKDNKSHTLGYSMSVDRCEFLYCDEKANHITSVANRPEASSQPQLQEALLREAKAFSDRAELLSAKIED